ncbi:hypothetical protein MTO96_029027 [Rhipicephalus appendiculatus]
MDLDELERLVLAVEPRYNSGKLASDEKTRVSRTIRHLHVSFLKAVDFHFPVGDAVALAAYDETYDRASTSEEVCHDTAPKADEIIEEIDEKTNGKAVEKADDKSLPFFPRFFFESLVALIKFVARLTVSGDLINIMEAFCIHGSEAVILFPSSITE